MAAKTSTKRVAGTKSQPKRRPAAKSKVTRKATMRTKRGEAKRVSGGWKSPIRKGGRYLDHLLDVLEAASKRTSDGQEFFTTAEIVEDTDLVYSSVYRWLKGLEARGIVEGYLDISRSGRGDYRWRLLKTLGRVATPKFL